MEGQIRQRVRALPAVQVLDGCDAAGLEVSADGRRIIGLRVLPRADGTAAQVLPADVVVDASGRGSRTPVWLERLGYPRPVRDEVRVGLAYATRRYRIDSEALRDRGGFIQLGEPLGDPIRFTFPVSARNRYERLRRFPDGLLVIGDAVCSFNPFYGQGMSVAALEALALRDCLRGGAHRLAPRFFRAAAKIVDRAWEISVTGDLRLPEVIGRRTLKVRLINAYLPHLHAAARVDSRVATAFLRVSNLLDPPPRLMSPVLMVRVLRANLRRREVPLAPDRPVVASRVG